jgi:hypothetical protein
VYFKAATDPSYQNDWLIYLQGGDWCWDKISCDNRHKNSPLLMSSSDWTTTYTLSGIFDSSADHSPLHAVNLAFIRYCTSDGHMGDRAASDETFGYHFRGRRVIAASIAALKTKGLANGHSQRLFFGGASAGGRGAMAALDFVSGYLNQPAVSVFGVLDSPLWIDQVQQ